MKTIWHVKDKRHYIVDSETPSYYFLRVGTEKSFTVKQVHKKFCVDKQPVTDKNSFTITIEFNIDVPNAVFNIYSVKSLAQIMHDVYDMLADKDMKFIRFNHTFLNKGDIFSINVVENAKP